MENPKKHTKTEKAEIKKQNQDFPNIPAASDKINSEKTVRKEVRETSELHNEGKTDNTEKNQ